MHTKTTYNRRDFIKTSLTGSALLWATLYASCRSSEDGLSHIKGSIVGPDSATGHLLRNTAALPRPSRVLQTDILIIGGGISGLSAKRWLQKNGQQNVMLVEMANHLGGNSHSGKNSTSAYPWGAHYIPVPDVRNTELLDFLREENIITGYSQSGLPTYNDYYLCHDPEERLFINGMWQEGIIPSHGIPESDKKQIKDFLARMAAFKSAIGNDERDAFCIPLDNCSADAQYRDLDKISFASYLTLCGYTSAYLLWYLEYCCKDDYGCNLENTSAWAGIHYFASRKGKGSNAEASTVLTWPEGNGFLAERLRAQVPGNMHASQLVYQLQHSEHGIEAYIYDVASKTSYSVTAKKIILCTPQFVNKHLLGSLVTDDQKLVREKFHYAPWVIANITINDLPDKRGMPLCWDNVIYGTQSVGYINANHQDVKRNLKNVLTFYLPLAKDQPTTAREYARSKTHKDWLEQIVKELEFAHTGISACIEQVDIWIWAHGMIGPTPGFVWGEERKLAGAPINDSIFFAHSDLSGVSIFEEAFYQGIKAAKQAMGHI